MNDDLAEFRRKPLKTSPTLKPKEAEKYSAFGTKDRVERLRIRRTMAPTRAPRYAYLQDMAYDGDYGTNFVLVFEFMMVLVRGQNLQGAVQALESGTCDFIQEYHPDLWAKPADDEPVIESLQIVMKGLAAESEKAGKKSDDSKPH